MHEVTITIPGLPTKFNSQQIKISWFKVNLCIWLYYWKSILYFRILHQRRFVKPLMLFDADVFHSYLFALFPKTIKSDCLSHTLFGHRPWALKWPFIELAVFVHRNDVIELKSLIRWNIHAWNITSKYFIESITSKH